jgi:peptide-methionine (S)-S-oxide reductase
MARELITLGGGCFWCTEAVYEQVDGVTAVESGYSNGHLLNPSYEQVCGGDTGHNEVVRVSFDNARITLREVLEIFFAVHDPTHAIARVPTSARSTARHLPARRGAARGGASGARPGRCGARRRVVTELCALDNYSRAEAYHQHYFAKNPHQGYCAAVVGPKVDKFRKTFSARLKR